MMKAHDSRAAAILKALATVVIWGATFVATKLALMEASPATIVWLRFAMGLLILGLALRFRGEAALPRRSDLAYLALLGFIGIAFHQWLQSNGLLTAQATTTAWIVASSPIFIAVLGAVVLKERLNVAQVIGIGLAALGVVLVVSKGDVRALLAGRSINSGDVLILISAINWAVYTVLSRRGLTRLPPLQMTFHLMLFGWIAVTGWFIASSGGLAEIGQLSARVWTAIAALGIFGSGVAYVLYSDALRVLPAAQLGVFLNVEPLITMLLAAPLLGEVITGLVILGGALIVAGIYLVNRR